MKCQAGVMPSALGKRHLRWLIAVRPRVRRGRKSKIEIGMGMVVWVEVGPPLRVASATISMSLLEISKNLGEISSPATILIESPHALAHFFNIYYIIYMVKKPASG